MDRVEEIPLRVTPVLRVPISGVAGIRIPVRPGVLSDCPFRRVRPGLIDPGPVALETALDRGLAPEVMPGARHSSPTGLMRAVATVGSHPRRSTSRQARRGCSLSEATRPTMLAR